MYRGQRPSQDNVKFSPRKMVPCSRGTARDEVGKVLYVAFVKAALRRKRLVFTSGYLTFSSCLAP